MGELLNKMLEIEEGKENLEKMITPKVTDDLRLLENHIKQRDKIVQELEATMSNFLSTISDLAIYSYEIEKVDEGLYDTKIREKKVLYIGDICIGETQERDKSIVYNFFFHTPSNYDSILRKNFRDRLLNNDFTEEKIRQLLRTTYDKKFFQERLNLKDMLKKFQDALLKNKTALIDGRIELEKAEEYLKKFQEEDAHAHGFFKKLETGKLVKKQKLYVESLKSNLQMLKNEKIMYENKIAFTTSKLEDTGEQEIERLFPLEKEKFDTLRQLEIKRLRLEDEYAMAKHRVEAFKGSEEYEQYLAKVLRLERTEYDLLYSVREKDEALPSLEEYEEIKAAATSTEDTALKRAAIKLQDAIYTARRFHILNDEPSVRAKSKGKGKGKGKGKEQ